MNPGTASKLAADLAESDLDPAARLVFLSLILATGKDDAAFDFADELASNLAARDVRVLFDDRRGVSPGVKFNDSELIGVPTIVVVGRGLADGVVEVKDRASGEREDVGSAVIVDHLVSLVRS